MTKIESFIERVQDENILVSNLLREAKLLAAELDQTDFLRWLKFELEGYRNGNNYPEYRTLTGSMKAWNPYYGWMPVLHKSSEVEKQLTTRSANQSIREIEVLLSNKSDTFEMPYSSSVANQILEGGYQTKVSMFISRSSLARILDAVRNRLLDWAVELQKKGCTEGTMSNLLLKKNAMQKKLRQSSVSVI